MSVTDNADSERQLAANELRRMGLRVPCLKATPTTGKQATSDGWPLFGVDILDQPQQFSHLVAGLTVPWFLDESLRVLISHASTEGILRKSGSLSRQRLLRTSLEMSASLNIASVVLASAPVHDVSGLLKQWLQLLPEPLLPKPLIQLLLRCQMKHGLEAVLLSLRILPEERLACLRHLLSGLSRLAADPLSRMGPHNLAVVLAPTLCCPSAVQTANREDLDRLVSLVEVLIGSSHLVGSTPPPAPGREGRKKTTSACLLLNQLRRLVVQRKGPGGEMEAVVPDSTAPSLPLGSKRRKPRELLPRGLSPWKRQVHRQGPGASLHVSLFIQAKPVPILMARYGETDLNIHTTLLEPGPSAGPRCFKEPVKDIPGILSKREEEPVSSRQQQQAAATSELLGKLREEVALLPPLQVEDEATPKPGDTDGTASSDPPETAVAAQEGDSLPNNTQQQQAEPKTELAIPLTVHFLRGSSTTSSTKSNLRRGRPNSLRSGLPSPRPLRHGPTTRRHASTGSRPRPPVGKENLESSLRFASQGDSIFNAPAMAHLAAVKARREAFISQLVSTVPTGLEHGRPRSCRESSTEVPHSHLDTVIEAPLTPAKEEPKEEEDVRPSEKPEDDVEPMDVDESPDTDSTNVVQEESPPCPEAPPPPAVAAEAPALPGRHEETAIMAAPTKIPSKPVAPAPCDDSFSFALPAIPPEPSPSTKRESIIQIRERNAGMVRSNVEVFNRVAAAGHRDQGGDAQPSGRSFSQGLGVQ
ncbi:hypothetical protein HPB50_025907 [Hyalomma asiaticum]|uniref:Uncharacterized protein n=1 Tax=Hyalomma asiaticum TaxID=266040 RepID=A0ACB7RVH4_HYAAI|nr:hypothetical protein HPB50_025907 [Hyalomma asiaticum]